MTWDKKVSMSHVACHMLVKMIRELHEKLINREITATELAQKYFDVIEKKDGKVKAYLTLTKELAMAQAQAVDEKIAKGEEIELIEGIPGAIKDNICISGTRTTASSKILDSYIAPNDATVVKKIKESGAVILGKTNLDEFAMGSSTENSPYQKTSNPLMKTACREDHREEVLRLSLREKLCGRLEPIREDQ